MRTREGEVRAKLRCLSHFSLSVCLFHPYLVRRVLRSSKVEEVRWRCVQVLLGVWEKKGGACAGSRATITQAACGLAMAAKTSHSARLRLSPRAIQSFLHPSTRSAGCCPPLTPNHTQMV